MTGVNEIRATFLDYFRKNGHEVVASSSLVPRNDPTLMFTNAGMVQFKNVFTGQETRPYVRATTSQKCVRAGGKHNDLDNVGYTARHHTFFEMLGNFSFGDYFKERAIELAWGLITKDFALSKDRLWITVHPADDVARGLWRKIAGISNDRIIGHADNLWAMGPVGPCGYCSEIFYDQGEKVSGGPPGSANEDGDRFLEFWNLVFMQFEQIDETTRVELPKPSIDTGMGLERITAILEGVTNNYDTDLFKALIAASVEATGVKAQGENTASHRIIADHLRASSFLISDGVLPLNEGRGYVLRRIMRRAMRHAELLGAKEPLMHRLVPALVRQMGESYPELARAQPLITQTLLLEETRFRKTLERGLTLLNEETTGLKAGETLSGAVAFKLHDTFGFPLDLTQEALRARKISVDREGFDAAMEAQRIHARKAWKGSGDTATEAHWFEIRERLGGTEFLGYETLEAEGVIWAIVKDGVPVNILHAGESGSIVTNQTPFYGESGGQVGDQGMIKGAKATSFEVRDTRKRLGNLMVHDGTLRQGELKVGDAVQLTVDPLVRGATQANHSATHLLHEALRLVLGDHISQKGSLVSPDRLRFDFSHQMPLTARELADVEARANAVVLDNTPVETRLMALEEAMQTGARALFGEKYSDEVRVVSMGPSVSAAGSASARAWSVELCGGTHVNRTGDIGLIRVTGETASAAGVRRIEALTGAGARAYLSLQDERVREVATLLKTRPDEVVQRLATLLEEKRVLEKQLSDSKRQLAQGGGGEGTTSPAAVMVGSVKVLSRTVSGLDPKDLRTLIDTGKREVGSGVVIVAGATAEGKAAIAVGVTEDRKGQLSAVDLIRAGVEALGGKGGGGRADLAQAGGPDGAKAQAAVAAILDVLRKT